MKYADLIDGEATPSELRSFLVDGENVGSNRPHSQEHARRR